MSGEGDTGQRLWPGAMQQASASGVYHSYHGRLACNKRSVNNSEYRKTFKIWFDMQCNTQSTIQYIKTTLGVLLLHKVEVIHQCLSHDGGALVSLHFKLSAIKQE